MIVENFNSERKLRNISVHIHDRVSHGSGTNLKGRSGKMTHRRGKNPTVVCRSRQGPACRSLTTSDRCLDTDQWLQAIQPWHFFIVYKHGEHGDALIARDICRGEGHDGQTRREEITLLMTRDKGFNATIVSGYRSIPGDGSSAHPRLCDYRDGVGQVADHGIERICTCLTVVRNSILVAIKRECLGDITRIWHSIEIAVDEFPGEDLALVRDSVSIAVLLGSIGNLTGVRNSVRIAIRLQSLGHIANVIFQVEIAICECGDPDRLSVQFSRTAHQQEWDLTADGLPELGSWILQLRWKETIQVDPFSTLLAVHTDSSLRQSCKRCANNRCANAQTNILTKQSSIINIWRESILIDPHAGDAVIDVCCATFYIFTGRSHE